MKKVPTRKVPTYEVAVDLPHGSADGTTAISEVRTGDTLVWVDPNGQLQPRDRERLAAAICEALNRRDPLPNLYGHEEGARWP